MSVSAARALLLAPPQPARGPYTYASTPRALYNNAKFKKEPPCGATGGGGGFSNVMHDKRVVRGSTFAAHPHAAGDGAASLAARARRAAAGRGRGGRGARSPPPAPGRRHRPLQTDHYLEELFDRGAELEAGVQTELWADRPATPRHVPAKTGRDQHTQIYPGDLFDFDLEVQAILEALVGKTSEQALAEVAQEEELSSLREQQRRYEELRDAERAERQRLADQQLRLNEEKERRVAEARVAQIAAVEARQRAAAAVLVQGYVAELLPGVLAGLRDQGYLTDRLHRGVEEEVVPWIIGAVSREVEALWASRELVSLAVREVATARAQLYRQAGEAAEAGEEPPESDTEPEPDDEEEEMLEQKEEEEEEEEE